MYDNLNSVTKGFEEKAKKLGCGSGSWISKAKSVGDQPLLTKSDSIVANMPGDEKTKLLKRFSDIIPDSAPKYDREYDDHFLEALVEILGWGWLKERYSRYKPKFTMGTPDLVVEDDSGNPIAAMECKKIRTSDEDREYYKSQQGKAKRVKDNLISSNITKNPFLRKLNDTLCKAEKQVSVSQATDKFIFLDLSFDTPLNFPILKNPIICKILVFASKLCQKGISLVSFEQFQVDKPITSAGLP